VFATHVSTKALNIAEKRTSIQKIVTNITIQFRFKMKRYEWVVKGRFYRWQ
jgi:hypothetical protein